MIGECHAGDNILINTQHINTADCTMTEYKVCSVTLNAHAFFKNSSALPKKCSADALAPHIGNSISDQSSSKRVF